MKTLSLRLTEAVGRLADLQVGRPFLVLAVALVTLVPAFFAARGLELRTDFSELLPDNKPSVVEMRRVSRKLTSASTLTLTAEVAQPNADALARFADAVAPKLEALGPEWVGAVDRGRRAQRVFLEKNALLYAPLADVQKLHDDLRERYDYEVHRGDALDLGDDAPPAISASTLRERFSAAGAKSAALGDHYIGENGRLLAVLVRTPVEPGSVSRAKDLMSRVEAIVRAVDPSSYDATMRVRYTGDFITGAEEYRAIKDDLGRVGLWGVALVLGAVFVFFLRARTLVAMAVTIAIGLAWTFGLTRLTVGHLNSSTGFLVSIIAGNGINFGIVYMARYLEARRTGAAVREAVRVAHRSTWLPTLAAAGAAAVAYGSLLVTDFRGFKHFGIIGGTGMALCWIATYAFLPAVLVVADRWRPIQSGERTLRQRLGQSYGRALAVLVDRFPVAVVIVGAALGAFAIALGARYVARDPMEYDMAQLRNETTGRTPARELSHRVDAIVGRMGQDGMAIMVDRLDQVIPLARALEAREEAARPDAKPFERVVTLFDLLPKDQDQKLPLVSDMRRILDKARARGLVSTKDWNEIEAHFPASSSRPLGMDDLPEELARPFTDRDGARGRIVYIAPKEGRSVWDAHYLELWADSFRTVPLPDGTIVRGSGRAVLFADMLEAVSADAPKAIAASFLGTLLVVLIAFRGSRAAWPVIGALLLGVAWMVAFLAVRDIKLNFLNFVALPITFGIGVDYAVNVMHRYRLEGKKNLYQIVVETGGAVVLCSLTTTLGYISLALSTNGAIVTFGLAAAAGEIACITAAVLVLPAALTLRDRWAARTPGRAVAPHSDDRRGLAA